MKKSNIKYLIFSGLLIIASLCFLISVIFFSSTYIYSFFDITGLGKYIQIIMTLILLIIAIVSIVKSVRAIKYGVDFNFNKHFFIVFAVFIILSIAGFFCVRRIEENVSQKMARDIANIEQSSGPGNALMQSEAKHQAYHKYVDKEKHYIRKSQIATQIKYSPFIIERYRNLLFHNPNYLYYDALGGEEVAYYSVFLKMVLVGVVGAAFYGFNFFSKRKKTKEYYANYNNYNNEAEE